jgi:hypothetical protein
VHTGKSQIVVGRNIKVRLDRKPLAEAVAEDWKVSLALRAWTIDTTQQAAPAFLANMRRIFNPDPAHMLDSSSPFMAEWRFIDFRPHPFVMDGAQHRHTEIGQIREHPVKYAAEQTYGLLVRDAEPACFTVSMPDRVYQRLMLPFFGREHPSAAPTARPHLQLVTATRVTRVVTLIKPITARATLAEVIAETDDVSPGLLTQAQS